MKLNTFFGMARASSFSLAMGLIVCATLVFASSAMADDEESQSDLVVPKLASDPAPLDKTVEASIDHLFTLLSDPSAKFDPSKIDAMLNMVGNDNSDPKDIAPANRFNGNGVCLRHTLNADLDTIMRYFYNTDIPSFLLSPATLRFSNWYDDSEFMKRATPLWEEWDNYEKPVLTRGREFESCTPDSFGEAYFAYDLDRLIVLLKYEGKRVLVSVSLQDGESDVGRKGAIINDKEWDYFYSGIEGLNKGLISWMDTYMYNSASVLVFVEQNGEAKQSTLFLYKWLKAGWSGMNVVKRKHIYEGIMRYARSMEKVLTGSTLTPEQIAAGMNEVTAMTKPQIDTLIEQYSKNFEQKFKSDPKLKKRSYAKVIADGGYGKVLDDRARRYTMYLEKLKSMLGMETLIDMGSSTAAK